MAYGVFFSCTKRCRRLWTVLGVGLAGVIVYERVRAEKQRKEQERNNQRNKKRNSILKKQQQKMNNNDDHDDDCYP